MAIVISDKSKCSGCGACMNICPKHCISMESDITGFLYPVIDYKDCIECGICEKTCPMLNQEKRKKDKEESVKVYAGWSKDIERRYNSTSGGIFSELAGVILEKGGVVAGAAYNHKCDVEHIVVSDLEGIPLLFQNPHNFIQHLRLIDIVCHRAVLLEQRIRPFSVQIDSHTAGTLLPRYSITRVTR